MKTPAFSFLLPSEHMKVKQAYDAWSGTYDDDRNLTRDLDQEIMQRTLAQSRYRLVLEIGCGTGKNTAQLETIAEKVIALDFSWRMIRRAKEKTRSDRVIFCVAELRAHWPIESDSVDLVTCNLVLEHIEDLSIIFSEAARVLVKNGILFISELHPFRQYQGVVARFNRDAERVEIPAFVHHISDFLEAAETNELSLLRLEEAWHSQDESKPPRLLILAFRK